MNHRFTLVITVTKHDDIGKVLKRMASGTVVGFDDFEKGIDAKNEFMDLVKTVLVGQTEYRTYGHIVLVDERDGTTNCLDTFFNRDGKRGDYA